MFFNELHKKLIERMPYSEPFLFVDNIVEINEKKVIATYFFSEKLDFYKGHFKHKPLTPGAIMLEAMGQVGCVLFGIYLLKLYENDFIFEPILGLMHSDFFASLYPNTLVTIESDLDYLRDTYISSINYLYDEKRTLIAMSKIQCSFKIYEQ